MFLVIFALIFHHFPHGTPDLQLIQIHLRFFVRFASHRHQPIQDLERRAMPKAWWIAAYVTFVGFIHTNTDCILIYIYTLITNIYIYIYILNIYIYIHIKYIYTLIYPIIVGKAPTYFGDPNAFYACFVWSREWSHLVGVSQHRPHWSMGIMPPS